MKDFFYLFLFATIPFWCGYYGGNRLNWQYRDPDGKIRRMSVSKKYQCLFHLNITPPLMWAVIMQMVSWISTFIIIVIGCGVWILVSPQEAVRFAIQIVVLYIVIMVIIVFQVGLIYHKVCRKGRAPKQWGCEIETAVLDRYPVRYVKVLYLKRSTINDNIYVVQYGRIFKRQFEALSQKKVSLETNTIVKMRYYSGFTPRFSIILEEFELERSHQQNNKTC